MAARPQIVQKILNAERLRKARRRIAESSFIQNSLALFSGTVATQAIVFLFSPLLSRIFGLEDFGTLANYNAWVAILALVSSLRYEHAVFVAHGRKNMNRVITLTAVLSAGSFLAYALIAGALMILYKGTGYISHIRGILPFIPFGVLGVCWTSLLTQINVKTGRFRRLAVMAALQVVVTVFLQIVLGVSRVENGLIIGTIAGFVFSGAVLSWLTLDREFLHDLARSARFDVLRETAGKHINFPRFALAADGISVVAQQFIPVFVLALFSPAIAGLYAFSMRVVRVPLIVISTAVTGALRKEAVDRLLREGNLTRLFTVTVKGLFVVALVPFVVMLFYSSQIFSAIFGSKWAEAGKVVQILSPGILLEFVAFPLSVIFLVTNTQKYTLAIQLLGFLALVAALFVGRRFVNDFISTCYLISGIMVLVNIATIGLAARVSHGDEVAEILGENQAAVTNTSPV